jgi:hypothetical protein
MRFVVSLGLRSTRVVSSIVCWCRRNTLLGAALPSGSVLRQDGNGKSNTSNKRSSDRKLMHPGIEPRVMEGIVIAAGARQLGSCDGSHIPPRPAC